MVSSKLVILAIVSSVFAAPAPQLIQTSTVSSVPELTSTTSATFAPSTVSSVPELTSATFLPSTVSPSSEGATTLVSSLVTSLGPPTSLPQISGISTTSSTIPGSVLTSATGELPSGECSDVSSVITITETVSATSAPTTTVLGSAVTSDVDVSGEASSVVSTVTNDTGSTVLLSTSASTVATTDSTGVITTITVSATTLPSEVTSSFIGVPSGAVSSFTDASSGVVSSFTAAPSSVLISSIATF